MSDFPSTLLTPNHSVISSIGAGCQLEDQWVAYVGAATAQVWPAANRALFVPIIIEQSVTVYQIAIYNGATVAGNVDAGIYDLAGNKIITKGTTVMAGVSTIQLLDITDTALNPGNYYLAMASDSATATFFCGFLNTNVAEGSGFKQQATAFVLPATATYAAPASQNVPVITASFRATI